jgi:hypothetical protein
MAGVLAMGVAISSLALAAGVNAARTLETTPPPAPEPVAKQEPVQPAPEPVAKQEPAQPAPEPAQPAPEPVAKQEPAQPAQPVQPAPEPVQPAPEPAQPAQPVQQGGAIGRPKWGPVSSNVLVPALPGTAVDTVKDALGVRRNPNELRLEIIEVTKKMEAANLRAFQFSEKYKRLLEPYKDVRQKFAKHSGESKRYEALSAAILKKLNTIGQQRKENDPEIQELKKQIDALEKNDPARKALEERKKEMLKPSAIDPKDVNPLTETYGTAVEKKIEADDLLEQAKFEQERSYAELMEVRAKQVEQEKLAKELKTKRDALLLQLQVILLSRDATTTNAADWQARTERYANAIRKKKIAEEALQAFYSETWMPLQLDPKNQQAYHCWRSQCCHRAAGSSALTIVMSRGRGSTSS